MITDIWEVEETQQEPSTHVLGILSYPSATEVSDYFRPFAVSLPRKRAVPTSEIHTLLLDRASRMRNGRDKGSMVRRIAVFEFLASESPRRYLWQGIQDFIQAPAKVQLSNDLNWLCKHAYIQSAHFSGTAKEYWVE